MRKLSRLGGILNGSRSHRMWHHRHKSCDAIGHGIGNLAMDIRDYTSATYFRMRADRSRGSLAIYCRSGLREHAAYPWKDRDGPDGAQPACRMAEIGHVSQLIVTLRRQAQPHEEPLYQAVTIESLNPPTL